MKIRRRIFASHIVLVSLFLLFLGAYGYMGIVRAQTDTDLTRLYRVKSAWGDMLISMNNIVNNWEDGRSYLAFRDRLALFDREVSELQASRLRSYYPMSLRRNISALYEIWQLARGNTAGIIARIENPDFQRVVREVTREPGLQRLNHLWVSLFYGGGERGRSEAYAVRQVLDSIEFFPIYSDTITRQFDVIVAATTRVSSQVVHVELALSLSFFLLFLLVYFTFSVLFTRSIARPIVDASLRLTEFIGQSIHPSRGEHRDELDLLHDSVTTLIEHYTYLSQIAHRLSEGDIESSSFDFPARGVVGNALYDVSRYLRRLAEVSAWVREGRYGSEVALSSEKDVLGRAFNIMSHEIHGKITTLSRVFDAIDEAILVVDSGGEIVESNNRLLALIDVPSVQEMRSAGGLARFVRGYPRLRSALLGGQWRENRPATMITVRGQRIPVRISARLLDPIEGHEDRIMLFITNESWKVRARRERERLKSHAVLAELKALRAQINPHFLFNTLNTIIQLIESDPARAVGTTEQLADLFRYAMATTERPTVPVSEELLHVRQFLQIEQARFEENLEVLWEIDESVEGERMPPMLLQPIVENALLHGKDALGRVSVTVRAKRRGDDVLFQVCDSGATTNLESFSNGRGLGLRNVNDRLRTMYGRAIAIERNEPQGVVVSMCLPAGTARSDRL